MSTIQQPVGPPIVTGPAAARQPVLVVAFPKTRGVKHLIYAAIFGAFLLFQIVRVLAHHGTAWTYFLIAFNSIAAPTCVVLAVLAFLRDRPVIVAGPTGVLVDTPLAGRTRIPWSQFAGAEVTGSGADKFLAITCLDPESPAIERTKAAATLCTSMNKQKKLAGAAWLPARHLPRSPERVAEELREIALVYLEPPETSAVA